MNKKERTRDALSTFVPTTMKWILSKEGQLKAPYSRQFPSVALFADVSGFTKLSERLSDNKYLPSSFGTETLADNINSYLTMIVREIVGAGGDIFKFAGDALLCVWPPAEDEMNDIIAAWKNLSKTVLRVIQCALVIQRKYPEMSKTGVDELTLRVKLGIGVGNVDVLVVGGVFGRYENLTAGQAFFEAFNCENDCEPKQVIISQKCYQMVKKKLGDCVPVGDKGNFLVSSIKSRVPKSKNTLNIQNDDLFKKLKCYIPSAVVPHLRMPEQLWAGELRQVTIMFLSLPFTSADIKTLNDDKLNDIHQSIKSLQHIIYKYQGSLNKFLVDDKGSTVMAVFGLPPVAHRNDSERAVMAALDLKTLFITRDMRNNFKNMKGLINRLPIKNNANNTKSNDNKKHKDKPKKKKKHIIAIGITSGNVYLGLVGGAGSRREYTVLGDRTNLAARLMGLSKKKSHIYGEVIVDSSMKNKICASQSMDDYIMWEFIKEEKVKGKKKPVKIWKPKPRKYKISLIIPPTAWLTDDSDKSYMSSCCKVIASLCKTGYGKIVFVEGEVGLGKAALISRVHQQTKSSTFWLWGRGSWLHETKDQLKFPVWKQILLKFNTYYNLNKKKHRDSFHKYIEKRRPDLEKWMFLLSYFGLIQFANKSKFKGTIWERNEKLVQELKNKIKIKMTDEMQTFQTKLDKEEKDSEIKKKKKKIQEAKWKKEAESKVNKKIGNYIYDIVLVLLEWAGGKVGTKPIAIVIDCFQWLRVWDWSLTRRLCVMLKNKIIKYVTLFVSTTPMDIERYTPHYIQPYYTQQYTEIRDKMNSLKIVPAAWGIQKTKKYVKSYFKYNHDINVRDVSPKLVEIVHSQSGGRPGFCKEFLDLLFKLHQRREKEKGMLILKFEEMRFVGEKKLSFSSEFEDYLSSRIQYSSIPIPPLVKAVTSRHLDVLKPEELLCLKTASSICVAKGTRCLAFLKSTLKGSHPIKLFQEETRLNRTIKKLCKMKFIMKINDLQDISYALNAQQSSDIDADKALSTTSIDDVGIGKLYKMSSQLNNTQHGHLENKYHTSNLHHYNNIHNNGINDDISSIKGRYGDHSNNVVIRNRMHTSLSDASNVFSNLNHLRSLSSLSTHDNLNNGLTHDHDNMVDMNIINEQHIDYDDDMKNSKVGDDANQYKLGDNMPATSTLMMQPLHSVPWKFGKLIKKKDGMFHAGQERLFAFKERTLYWFTEKDAYPLGRIKFNDSILRLKCDLKKCEIIIKVSRKKYSLREPNGSKDEIQKWFQLFQTAMNSDIKKDNNQNQNQPNTNRQKSAPVASTTITSVINSIAPPLPAATQPNISATNVSTTSTITTATAATGTTQQTNVNTNAAAVPPNIATTTVTTINDNHSMGECYEFTHGFLRDCIYEQMLYIQRIKIHKRAQEYLRKVLSQISYLSDYPNKFNDTKSYSLLLQRHQAIEAYYQYLQDHVGEMSADDYKMKKKKKNDNDKYNFHFNFTI